MLWIPKFLIFFAWVRSRAVFSHLFMVGGHLDRRLSVCPFRDAQNYDASLTQSCLIWASFFRASLQSLSSTRKCGGLSALASSSPWLSRSVHKWAARTHLLLRRSFPGMRTFLDDVILKPFKPIRFLVNMDHYATALLSDAILEACAFAAAAALPQILTSFR